MKHNLNSVQTYDIQNVAYRLLHIFTNLPSHFFKKLFLLGHSDASYPTRPQFYIWQQLWNKSHDILVGRLSSSKSLVYF